MFFMYKKNKKLQSRNLINLDPFHNANANFRVLIISSNSEHIKYTILPVSFILKEWDSFLVLYKFQTIRNYDMVREDLRALFLKKNYQTFLIPTKSLVPILRILFLFKIPFHFPKTNVSGILGGAVDTVRLVKYIYGTIRLNLYLKKISIT